MRHLSHFTSKWRIFLFMSRWCYQLEQLLLVSTGEKRSSSNCGYLGWNRTICGRFDYQVRSWFWHKSIIGWRALSLLRSRSLSRHATLLPTFVGRSVAWRDKERLRRRLNLLVPLFLLCSLVPILPHCAFHVKASGRVRNAWQTLTCLCCF